MKITYVTPYDPLDVSQWSGTSCHLAKALEQTGADVGYVGSLGVHPTFGQRCLRRFYRWRGGKYQPERSPSMARRMAAAIESRLPADPGILFSPGSIPLSMLRTPLRKAFYTDATFAGLLDFYPDFTGLCGRSLREGHRLERLALESASVALYSSDWAASTAIRSYGADPSRIGVVPIGANLEDPPDPASVRARVGSRPSGRCHLLFLGVDWFRKGGDLALDTARALNESGLPTTLHVAGIRELPAEARTDFVVDHGFIGKGSPEGRGKIAELLGTSHFLILPTRADCTPVVFCEADAFGLPAVTSSVGGIPTVVKDGDTGIMLSLDGWKEHAAGRIRSAFLDREGYQAMAMKARAEYESRLNWSAAAGAIVERLASP